MNLIIRVKRKFLSQTFDKELAASLFKKKKSPKNMSELEDAMITIIHVFHKYSGSKCKLKKAELKDLINTEMNNFITKIKEDEVMNELFADLDQNRDLEIDFQEFIAMIAMVTSSCHGLFNPGKHHNLSPKN